MNPLSKDKGVFIIYIYKMLNIVMLHTTWLSISSSPILSYGQMTAQIVSLQCWHEMGS